MNMKLLISSKELKHSIWVVIILTLIFGFNDGKDNFIWGTWLYNLFSVFILVVMTILAHMIGAKLAANRLGQEAEVEVVSMRGLKFNVLGARVDEKFDWIYLKLQKLTQLIMFHPFQETYQKYD